MAVERQPDVEQDRRRDLHVLVAGEDVERKVEKCCGQHQAANGQEFVEIVLEQSFVDQQLRDVWLGEAEHGRGHARKQNQDQRWPIRRRVSKVTAITRERRGALIHGLRLLQGRTTIPAMVVSLLRSQVRSYFSVEASYTSISNPAP